MSRAVALVENLVVTQPEPPSSTPVVPPSLWFPGLLHFSPTQREWALDDARAVLQAERIRPDGKRCIEVSRWP